MKANEEPKVLYLQPDSSHPAGKRYLNLNKVSDNDIEYIRKDAFIEKACDAYCAICDTKECGGTGECIWVENFRKRLMK